MSSYTIEITPDGGHGASMTVRVTVEAAAARIKEVTIRSADDGGLSGSQIPTIDFDLLMRAVAPAALPATIEAPAEPAPAAPAEPALAPAAAAEPDLAPAAPADGLPPATHAPPPLESRPVAAPPEAAESRKRARRHRSTRPTVTAASPSATGIGKRSNTKRNATKTSGTKHASGKAAAGKAPAGKAALSKSAAEKAAGQEAPGRRAYRRIPEDVVAVFRELNSVTAMARHYGVPRHTAQGWVGRLRIQQLLPPGR